MNVPARPVAGDTWTWQEEIADYPASAGWTATVALWRYGQAAVTSNASGSGSTFTFTIAAATTATIAPGEWGWTIHATKGTERYTVGSGTLKVKPNLAVGTATSAFQSHSERVLAAIEATIEGRATKIQSMMLIAGRQIQLLRPEELTKWRTFYLSEVAKEQDADKIATGGSSSRIVRARFGSA